jgi:hypothetical protein
MKPIKFFKKHLLEVINNSFNDNHNVPNLILRKEIQNSVNYAENHMKNAMMFFDSPNIWDYTVSKICNNENGIVLEFGVFEGTSINYMSKKLRNFKFHGFDSFEGLKEDWTGWTLQKGAFNLNGVLPQVNQNVELHKGWFDETLPKFIPKTDLSSLKLIHIDSDTYEACKTILDNLKSQISSGVYILFDEYFGYRGWEVGEYKAFNEFVNENTIKYKYIAFSIKQVLVEII